MTALLIGFGVLALLGVVASFVRAYYWREYRRRRDAALPGITDEQRQAVIRECFRTGSVVTGNIDEHGNFRMQVIEKRNGR